MQGQPSGTGTPRSGFLGQSRRFTPALLVLFSAILLVVTRLLDDLLLRGDGAYLSVTVLQIIIFLLPVAIWIRIRGEGYTSRLRLRPGRPESLLLTLSASVLLISGGLLLSMLFSGIRNMIGTFSLYEALSTDSFTEFPLYSVLAYAALPAIAEEILFRGVLCAEYERHGVSVSVLASAIFFVCIHFRFDGIPVYLFSGFVLALTAYLARSVWAAVLAHFIYNLFGLFGQPYLSSLYEITGSTALFVFVPIFLFLLSLAIFCGEAARLCRLYASRNYPNIEPPKAKNGTVVPFFIRMRAIFVRPEAIAVLAVWLVASILFLFLR